MLRPHAPLLLVLSLLVLGGCEAAADLLGIPVDPAGGSGPSGGSGQAMSAGERAWAMQVLGIVNQERQNAGLNALAWDEEAAQAAYDHCVDMDVRGFFAHDNPDGQIPGQRMTAAGVSWSTWGENIARGQPNPAAVMNAWMNSSGHRANILYPAFTHLGVGVHDSSGGPWWTQDFFAPR